MQDQRLEYTRLISEQRAALVAALSGPLPPFLSVLVIVLKNFVIVGITPGDCSGSFPLPIGLRGVLDTASPLWVAVIISEFLEKESASIAVKNPLSKNILKSIISTFFPV